MGGVFTNVGCGPGAIEGEADDIVNVMGRAVGDGAIVGVLMTPGAVSVGTEVGVTKADVGLGVEACASRRTRTTCRCFITPCVTCQATTGEPRCVLNAPVSEADFN